MRVAIYARYSSDRQNDASAADQIDRCRRFAEARGWIVRDDLAFRDEALSGASMDRPGIAALLVAVIAGRVDVILTEDTSRLSRREADMHDLIDRLAFARVGLIGIADGVDVTARGGRLTAGIRATMAAEYLRDLSDKTRRGMQARARAGLSTGGLPFGYRSRARDGGGFAIEIDEARAAIVRRIFAAYLGGRSQREIAAALNADGIDAPRARANRRGIGWASSAVRAILRNERYSGRWTFGVRSWVKEPGTNLRKKRPGVGTEAVERPELRIIDRATWAKVNERFIERAGMGPRRRVVHLLSGLLRCGVCGTVMTVHGGASGRRYYGCASARARGACANRKNLLEPAVRGVVVDGVRRFLADAPAHLQELIAEELACATAEDGAEREQVAARLVATEEKVRRLVIAVEEGSAPAAVLARIRDLEAQASADRTALAAMDHAAAADLPTPDELVELATDAGRHLDADPQVAREHIRDLLVDGALRAYPDAHGWTIRGGLVPARLLDRPPPAEDWVPGRAASDFSGCGGPMPASSDGRVVPVAWRIAA